MKADIRQLRALVNEGLRAIKEANRTPHSMALDVADDAMLALAVEYPALIAALDELESLRQMVPDDAEFAALQHVLLESGGEPAEKESHIASEFFIRVEHMRRLERKTAT